MAVKPGIALKVLQGRTADGFAILL